MKGPAVHKEASVCYGRANLCQGDGIKGDLARYNSFSMRLDSHYDDFKMTGPVDAYTGVPKETHGRNVSYDLPDPNLPDISQWLIGNPNRINLGRIGLRFNGDTLPSSSISNTYQELDLWHGAITSGFTIDDVRVKVVTQGDFESDAVVFTIESELIESGKLKVELDFPYPPVHTTKYKNEVFVGVYDFPTNHSTKLSTNLKHNTAHICHDLGTKYYVNLRWPKKDSLELKRLEMQGSTKPTAHRRNRGGWQDYWSQGGFVDLTESTNPNATELQRRIVTSQYHARVNSAADAAAPMYMAMLAFKSKPTKKTLKRWDPILEATADYMASYAWFNQSSGRYDLAHRFAIRGGDGNTPPPFMPGNAGFLLAVAYMAKGWDGSKRDTPGFPQDDGWVVKA
ncbi:hypothetical protein ACKAV7_014888 [Fusarium commune]